MRLPQAPVEIDDRERAMDRAEAALAAGDRHGARDALADAWRIDPDCDEAPLLAAMLYLQDGDPASAADLILEVLNIRAFHPRALSLLATACVDGLHPTLAVEIHERIQRLAPGMRGVRGALKAARRAVRELRGSNLSPAELRERQQRLPEDAIRAVIRADSPTLTVALTLTDESEAQLEDCLTSVEHVADEILVLDRHARLGIPEYDAASTWISGRVQDDDASSRDRLARRARSQWILFLDACETLDPASVDTLRRAVGDRKKLAFLLQVHDTEDSTSRLALRLVRNVPDLVVSGPTEPCVLPALRPMLEAFGLEIGQTPALLTRVAPRKRQAFDAAERERLLAIAEEHPDDTQVRIALARIELARKCPQAALAHASAARRTIEAVHARCTPLELEQPTVLEGLCLMRLEREEQLGRLLSSYHERHPPSASTLFLEGVAAKATGHPADAAEKLQAALALRRQPSFAEAIDEVRGSALPTMLGAAQLELGAAAEARISFTRALQRDPDDLQARVGLIAVRHADGEFEQVLRDLDELVERHGDNPLTWLAGAVLLGENPALVAPAVGWLEEASSRFPNHAEIRNRLGEAQLRCGKAEAALATLEGQATSTRGLAARAAAALACGRSLPAVALDSSESLGTELLVWFERWMKFGALNALDRALLDIQRAERALPGFGTRTADWLQQIGQAEAAGGVRSRIE